MHDWKGYRAQIVAGVGDFAKLTPGARKYLGGVDATDPLASPLFGELRGLPPLLLQVGTDERLLDDSLQFAERAARAGVSVQLEVWEGMHHVFQLDVAHLKSSRAALDQRRSLSLARLQRLITAKSELVGF